MIDGIGIAVAVITVIMGVGIGYFFYLEDRDWKRHQGDRNNQDDT